MDLGFDIKDWNEAEAIEVGQFEALALGGHEIEIIGAELYTSEQSGNTSLKIEVDIAGDDEQKGYFMKQYENGSSSKWPAGATRYLSLKKENLGYTKGFITSLEKSNNNFKFDTSKGWEQLKGLHCAGVFGLEEYINNEGKTRTATKLTQFRSLDKLSEIKIPRVRKLDGNYVDYNEYMDSRQTATAEEIFGASIVETDNGNDTMLEL